MAAPRDLVPAGILGRVLRDDRLAGAVRLAGDPVRLVETAHREVEVLGAGPGHEFEVVTVATSEYDQVAVADVSDGFEHRRELVGTGSVSQARPQQLGEGNRELLAPGRL